MSDNTTKDSVASVFAGGFAGIISTIVTNPLDTLRSRLAASRGATGNDSKSLFSHIKQLYRNGFIQGTLIGLGPNLLGSVPSNAIYLSSYRFLRLESQNAFGENHFMVPVVSALGAVGCTNATLAPLFTIRTRCQLNREETMRSVAVSIWKNDGFKGFYRGALVNALGRMVEETTFWCLYESSKKLTDEGNLTSGGFLRGSAAIVALSSMCKICGSAISFPYNVIMTHLREVDRASGTHKHTKFVPTVQYIYKADGVAGFYKGLQPHILRSAMSKALQIYAFELGMFVWFVANPKKTE